MRIKCLAPYEQTDEVLVVLETSTGDRLLGVVVPTNEANRLARVLGLTECGCTPVYDLIVALTTRLGASIQRTVLVGAPSGVTGTLVVEHEATTVTLPCHPADGLALALRARAPIYASPEALEHSHPSQGRCGGPLSPDEVERWLGGVRPDDFAAAPDP
jgi:bifunctional DNase/RNase